MVMLTYNQFRSKFTGKGFSNYQVGILWKKYPKDLTNEDLEKNLEQLKDIIPPKQVIKRVSLIRRNNYPKIIPKRVSPKKALPKRMSPKKALPKRISPKKAPPKRDPKGKAKLYVLKYSPQSYKLYGEDTKKIKNNLVKMFGLRYNPRLRSGGGWTIGLKKWSEVEFWLRSLPSDKYEVIFIWEDTEKEQEENIKKYKDHTSDVKKYDILPAFETKNLFQILSEIEDDDCSIALCFQCGELKLEEFFMPKSEILIEAIFRDFILTKNMKIEQLCTFLKSTLPSVEWQKKTFKTLKLLTEQDLIRPVESYKSYGFSRINSTLRRNPDSNADLNIIIDKFPPIDRDIYVFRLIDLSDIHLRSVYQNIDVSFEHLGYISTSIFVRLGYKNQCFINRKPRGNTSKSKKSLIRIKIPKGTRCFWFGDYTFEDEVLFKHKSILVTRAYKKINFVCSTTDDIDSLNQGYYNLHGIDFYDVEMII